MKDKLNLLMTCRKHEIHSKVGIHDMGSAIMLHLLQKIGLVIFIDSFNNDQINGTSSMEYIYIVFAFLFKICTRVKFLFKICTREKPKHYHCA